MNAEFATDDVVVMDARVTITERALVQRLKRRFARDGETFHVTRGGDSSRGFRDLGYWHTTENNIVRNSWHSIESLAEMARDWGVLRPYERVENEANGVSVVLSHLPHHNT